MAQPSLHPLPAKLYFRIGEVAELVGVEPHVLRYWEREFRSIRPTKSAKGQRVYSRRDVENLMRVRELLYQEGFTIAGARKRLHHGGDAEARGASEAHLEPSGGELAELHESDPPPPESEATVRGTRSEPAGGDAIDRHELTAMRAEHELTAMRAEIEAFLAELDAQPD